MALSCGSLLKPQTPLQQLLEEINFQRTKEMRQLLKDDSGFVVLQGTTYWTDLFVRHFLFQSEPVHSIDSDDLLFFVRKKHVKGSSRHMPKYETEVDVYRKDSRKLPIGDPDVDWEETVYLNMVIHQFDYTLTLAICTRTSPKELQVLRRHSQRVYASPSRRKMDTKGEGEEMTYPHICFMVDNFDEVFSDILVRDGEMVCVELVANDKDGSCQGVIFLGSIRYDALKKVYDARQSSLSSKVAQRMTFGLFSSGAGVQTRCEFVRMKGPQGKGHAEMAVTKPKGSGVETPTSEPGFCATDMWDEWEEDPDDYYNYRNQRRLSDPSANLNNYSRYGWRTKNHDPSSGCKARSENEGLDSLASEVSEIEAGDLRDDLRPASSATEMKMHKGVNDVEDDNDTAIISPPVEPCCTNCFGSNNCKNQCGTDNESAQMSDIYCRSPIKTSTNPINNVPPTAVVTFDDSADDENAINLCETPACLEKFPNKKTKPKHKNILNVESELIIGNKHLKKPIKSSTISNKLQTTTISNNKRDKKLSSPKKDFIKDKDKLKLNNSFKCKKKSTILSSSTMIGNNCSSNNSNSNNSISKNNKLIISSDNKSCKKNDKCNNKKNELNKHIVIVDEKLEEYEIADDVTSLNEQQIEQNDEHTKIGHLTEKDSKLMIRVHGKEELPAVDQNNSNIIKTIETNCNTTTTNTDDCSNTRSRSYEKCVPVQTKNHPLEPTTIILNSSDHEDNIQHHSNNLHDDDNNGDEKDKLCSERSTLLGDYNGNNNNNNNNNNGSGPGGGGGNGNGNRKNCEFNRALSLPRLRKSSLSGSNQQTYINKGIKLVPKRTTPDGTNIYYWCDLPKKSLKELDDGAYNPLWATKGFTQSFHFWKENRRQQSTPLNAFLTYVTLPWWSIAKDLLDHRETPILTF